MFFCAFKCVVVFFVYCSFMRLCFLINFFVLCFLRVVSCFVLLFCAYCGVCVVIFVGVCFFVLFLWLS